jgi:hypothetical protein
MAEQNGSVSASAGAAVECDDFHKAVTPEFLFSLMARRVADSGIGWSTRTLEFDVNESDSISTPATGRLRRGDAEEERGEDERIGRFLFPGVRTQRKRRHAVLTRAA